MNATRGARFAIAPVLLATLALSACQEEAPTAAPPAAPTSAAPSTSAPGAGGAGGTQSPQTQAPSTQAPTQAPSTQAPSTQAPSGTEAGGCKDTGSYTLVKRSVAAKPLTTPQTGKSDTGDAQVQITLGQPTIDTSGGDSFFPGEGMQTVIYPATIKMVSGSFFTVSYLKFGMVDGQDKPCKYDTLTSVLPRPDSFQVTSLKAGDSVSKKIAFAVPAGADLSKFSVLFADNYSQGLAELAWTGK